MQSSLYVRLPDCSWSPQKGTPPAVFIWHARDTHPKHNILSSMGLRALELQQLPGHLPWGPGLSVAKSCSRSAVAGGVQTSVRLTLTFQACDSLPLDACGGLRGCGRLKGLQGPWHQSSPHLHLHLHVHHHHHHQHHHYHQYTHHRCHDHAAAGIILGSFCLTNSTNYDGLLREACGRRATPFLSKSLCALTKKLGLPLTNWHEVLRYRHTLHDMVSP